MYKEASLRAFTCLDDIFSLTYMFIGMVQHYGRQENKSCIRSAEWFEDNESLYRQPICHVCSTLLTVLMSVVVGWQKRGLCYCNNASNWQRNCYVPMKHNCLGTAVIKVPSDIVWTLDTEHCCCGIRYNWACMSAPHCIVRPISYSIRLSNHITPLLQELHWHSIGLTMLRHSNTS